MRARHRVLARVAIIVACAAVAMATALACSSSYSEEEDNRADGSPPSSDAAPDDVSTAQDSTGSPLTDAGDPCPPRFVPQEGTYLYITYLGGDVLTIDDASVKTEPFKQPYVVTLRHDPAGPRCWTMTAYLADGPDGRHDHSWKFCNVCPASGSTSPRLDLVEERDYFVATAVSAVQTSVYNCGTPNPFVAPGTAIDAAVTQSACTGSTDGTQQLTVQVAPMAYTYHGQATRPFQDSDASVLCEHYTREIKVQVAGGFEPTVSTQDWYFDSDSGLPTWVVAPAVTHTKVGPASINFDFRLIMIRKTPDVSPLLPPRDSGL